MDDEYTVYLNGDYLPESEARVSVMDWGFSGGDAVYEVLRTFNGVPFRPAEHMHRLLRSARYIRLKCDCSHDALVRASTDILARNPSMLERHGEVAIWYVLSRGDRRHGRAGPPTLAIYCVPIDYRLFARRYVGGTALITPSVRRTSPESVEPKAKLTNRANQLLALFEVRQAARHAVPLMLDAGGHVAETNSANVFFVRDGRLFTPRVRNILEGITRNEVIALARGLNIDCVEADLTLYDVYNAQEAFTTSTTENIVPVASVNGQEFASPVPGAVTMQLIRAWCAMVDFDYVTAALSGLDAGTREACLEQWRQIVAEAAP